MSSHTHSAFGRLEIVETGRRRRWSEDEKVRIVLESLAGPRLVSATARRHGVSRAQLLTWRRKLKVEQEAMATPSFVPAIIEPEPPVASTPTSRARSSGACAGRIEIVLSRGRRVIVDAEVDSAALSRILDVLERR
jgi:transposase